ncbi:MAG: DsbE family thiol:disulfide interchange protein [Hyphomicrobiaceae bacterium]
MSTSSDTAAKAPADAPPAKRRLGLALLPVALFLGLAGLFYFALFAGDPQKLPSALIGKPAPVTSFEPLEGLLVRGQPVPGFSSTDLAKGEVSLVNFWASWCIPCVQEHPLLIEIGKSTGIPIYGINYKDAPEAARRFIGRYGNPYRAVGVDPQGRGAIEWGVYGMPESFLVDGQGRILYKHVGPFTPESVANKVIPAIEKAKRDARPKG